jgi:hypothetical protein
LVNNCLVGSDGTPTVYGFNARRKFAQVVAKQFRASDEQRFFANAEYRQEDAAQDTMHGHRASRALAAKRSFSGPATSAARPTRGAGSFSSLAPGGVRGHFHSTIAIRAKDGWPSAIGSTSFGSNIPEAERDSVGGQFNTYFKSSIADGFRLKCESAHDQCSDAGKWSTYCEHEFRADNPDRHGKFGRRCFDAQVREKPVSNRFGISEIEPKPMHEFYRQAERVQDFLDRTLPQGQLAPFRTHQPLSAQPLQHQEMASRAPVRSMLDGERKHHQLGFGQNRHSDRTIDMQLYTRPLGASQMDRLLPLA